MVTSNNNDNSHNHNYGTEPNVTVQTDEKAIVNDKKQKRSHHDWWDTDFIYDITNAYKINKSGYKTVQY